MIRRATPEDVERICALEAVLFPDNSMSAAVLERELEASWVFVSGDPLYAYAVVGRDGELLDLLRLGVDPQYQGRGAGTKLLKHVLSLGHHTMLLVRKDNKRALRLYRRHGFEVTGHFSGESASWVMHRASVAEDGP